MDIVVFGWTGKFNVGDEAYRLALPRLLPGHAVRFRSEREGPDEGSSGPPELAILGGGDVVLPAFTELIRGHPGLRRVAYSVTVTAASDFEFLRACERVTVRDLRSLAVCESRGVAARYGPDATFVLEPAGRPRGREWLRRAFAAAARELYERVVVVVVNGNLMALGPDALARDQQAFAHVAGALARVLDTLAVSAVFLPFGTGTPDDRVAASLVAGRCKWAGKNLVVYEPLGVQETLDVVAAADACVTSRFHAAVFAAVAAVPFVDLTHHDKNRGFLETVGLSAWSVNYHDLAARDVADRLAAHLDRPPGTPDPGLLAVTAEARRLLALGRPFS